MNVTKRVSEVVTLDQIKSWNNGDIVTIKAGTGTGKSYFIKNNLHAIAKRDNKKILMLLHRKNCLYQFDKEIEKDSKQDTIHLTTYQYLEYTIRKQISFNISQYDYIVCDEFHYWMSDAAFNKYTDMSLNLILNQNESIRLFTSATGDYMTKYLTDIKGLEVTPYNLPITYDHIKSLTFFHKEETTDKLVREFISNNQKSIIFIESAKEAYELHRKFKKHTIFNCSKSNKHYKYVDKKKVRKMLKDAYFDDLILITTTVMDAGINLEDESIQNVVCWIKDTGSLLQCIGRKRLQHENDYINLYIKSWSNKKLGSRKGSLKKNLEMAQYLQKYNVSKYINKYPREYDKNSIVYDDIVEGEKNVSTKKVNYLIYYKYVSSMNEIKWMLNEGEFGYCKYLSKLFGFYKEGEHMYNVYEDEKEKSKLELYLDSLVGKRLYDPEQEELKATFREYGLKTRTTGKKTINGNIEDRGLNYLIVSRRDRINVDGEIKKVTYWEVINNIES